jgi:S-adenosylmethionine synthetase
MELFDLRPGIIERDLKLRNPIYSEAAAYGHMGREYQEGVERTFMEADGSEKTVTVDLFTWENLNRVDDIKKAFGL